jgi:ABC-type sugar transport system substrate-binding protein
MQLIKKAKPKDVVISDRLVTPANVDEYLALYKK